MNNEEFNKMCEELRAQGFGDEDILTVIYKMFMDGKIDKDELGKLAGSLGYDLTPEFLAEQTPAPADMLAAGGEGTEGSEASASNISEDAVEDAQEVDAGEDEGDEDSEADSSDSDDEEDSEEDEKEQARKLFNLD